MEREMNWDQVRRDVQSVSRAVWRFVLAATGVSLAVLFLMEVSGDINVIPAWMEFVMHWGGRVLIILSVWLFLYERWTEGEV